MTTISSKELKQKIDAGETVHLIDVREPDERAEYNIGGVFLPLGKIMAMQTDDIDNLKAEEVICYCRSGQRSMQACQMLESLGFTNVKNLTGGMNDWRQQYGGI